MGMSELRLVQQLLAVGDATGRSIGDILTDWAASGNSEALRMEAEVASAMVAASSNGMRYVDPEQYPYPTVRLPDITPFALEPKLESTGFAVEFQDAKGEWSHTGGGVYKTQSQADGYIAKHQEAAAQHGGLYQGKLRVVEVFRRPL
jgi:hypothetical protein